jgi:hypothetical protein
MSGCFKQGADGSSVGRRLCRKRKDHQIIQQQADFAAFLLFPRRRASLDAVKQLETRDGRYRKICRAVFFGFCDHSPVPAQQMDACIGVEEMLHKSISRCSPCEGLWNEAGSSRRIFLKKPRGQETGFTGVTTHRSPTVSTCTSPTSARSSFGKRSASELPDLKIFAIMYILYKRKARGQGLCGRKSLRRAVTEFVEHFHKERTHQGLGNQIAFPSQSRCSMNTGLIVKSERLGGLLKDYYREKEDGLNAA